MTWLRDVRLLPVVLIAVGALFVLKTFGLVFDGGYSLGERMGGDKLVVTTVPATQAAQLRSPSVSLDVATVLSQPPKLSWMQEMFSYPSGDVTGSIHGAKPDEKPASEKGEAGATAAKKPGPAEPPNDANGGTVVATEPQRPVSPGERALLERLQARRQELDARARELDLREGMLKAAEQKQDGQPPVGSPSGESKPGEVKADPVSVRKDADDARFKSVVTMYEAMKPKDAAKIFDRLDIRILIEVASQIKPQKMAEILAQMSPEAAERLTVEMATRTGTDRGVDPSRLPKIEGRSGG